LTDALTFIEKLPRTGSMETAGNWLEDWLGWLNLGAGNGPEKPVPAGRGIVYPKRGRLPSKMGAEAIISPYNRLAGPFTS